MDDCDVNPITGAPDSQPFFIEEEEDLIPQRKRQLDLESQSQSLLAPKRRTTENSRMQRNPITIPQSEDNQTPQEEFALPNSEQSEQESEKYDCVLCNHDSNKFSHQKKDCRNECYGKLISAELELVEPCMRTYVYVEILKIIHRNKYKHMPLDDMQIKI